MTEAHEVFAYVSAAGDPILAGATNRMRKRRPRAKALRVNECERRPGFHGSAPGMPVLCETEMRTQGVKVWQPRHGRTQCYCRFFQTILG